MILSDDSAFLLGELADPEAQWSLGTFGALAEFSRRADEPIAMAQVMLSAVTPRGGIALTPRADMRLFASEGVTKTNWSHRVSLCLPEGQCAMSGRRVLTELGPDEQALRAEDRDATLFDLGLETLQVDACIRVADERIAADLRALTGRPVFQDGNPAIAIVVAASPHRVFLGRLGRVEVYTRIPPPGGKSPDGPHTHVLPELLAHRRTHSPTEPIPDGYVPCAHLYRAHPLKDSLAGFGYG